MAVTLLELKDGIREQSDTVGSGNITSAWLTIVANSAISEVYDIIVAAFEYYFVSSSLITLSTVNTFDLTTLTGGFYKEVGLDYLPGTATPVTVHKIDSFVDRNRYGSGNFAGQYRLHYTPNVTPLVSDGEFLPTEMIRWRELIDLAGAIRVNAKRQMNNPETKVRFDEVRKRIIGMVKQRMSEPTLIPLHDGDDLMSRRRYFIAGSTLTVYGGSDY